MVAGHPYLSSGRGEETRAWIQAFVHAGIRVGALDIYRCQEPTADFQALLQPHLTNRLDADTNLFMFDFSSFAERKNPYAVLRAFRRYCERHPYANVRLVLKVFDSHRPLGEGDSMREVLREELGRKCLERLILIDRRLSANEMSNLIRCCDSFLSLHRAEGFGRGLAEAMLLGKPVIGTAYSGNMQFMSHDNSCLVNYNLIPVPPDAYPAWEDQVWAEPDLEQALWLMEKLVRVPGWGRALGE